MSNPVKQHIIPEVYLKQFIVNQKTKERVVYCINFKNKFRQTPELKGVKSRIFWAEHFYNDKALTDEFAIEKIMASDFEFNYQDIITALQSEEPLYPNTINNIIKWLWVSKIRSPYYREKAKSFLTNLKMEDLNLPQFSTEEINRIVDNKKEETSKQLHTQLFYKPDQTDFYSDSFVPGILTKKWRILKSRTDYPFIANDNPGFSISNYPPFSLKSLISAVINIHPASTNYFVFSPKYCLEISSFSTGTQIQLTDIIVDISFIDISDEFTRLINGCTDFTKQNLLISNQKTSLEYYKRKA